MKFTLACSIAWAERELAGFEKRFLTKGMGAGARQERKYCAHRHTTVDA